MAHTNQILSRNRTAKVYVGTIYSPVACLATWSAHRGLRFLHTEQAPNRISLQLDYFYKRGLRATSVQLGASRPLQVLVSRTHSE